MENAPEKTVAPVENEPAERPARAERPQNAAPRRRKKVCIFCADKVEAVDYKDMPRLRKMISERGKILPRRTTGTCQMHQRQVTTAIKRARQVALLPYVAD